MADIDLKTSTPDTTLPATGFLFGADSQASASPSVYSTQAVATTLLGSTTLSGTTITANAPVVDFAQTWNNAAVTFTGAKLNITDTASNAASLLMDLQRGGNPQYQFGKNGLLKIFGNTYNVNTFFSINTSGEAGTIAYSSNGLGQHWTLISDTTGGGGPAKLLFGSGGIVSWQSNTRSDTGTTDLILSRRAAANLRLGAADAAAPVAQTLSVQSGVTGASATTVSISGTALTIAGTVTGTIAIGHAVTGTGVSAGTLITAGSGTSWTVNNSQTVGPITAYFNSVGRDFTITGNQASGPSAGGSIVFQVAPAGAAATTAQNALATALTIDTDLGTTLFGNLKFNSSSTIVTFGGSAGIALNGLSGSVFRTSIGISTGNPVSGASVILIPDAANTLALRNGTAAQTFRVYNTESSSLANFERLSLLWSGNAAIIRTESAGTGVARELIFGAGGGAQWGINTSGHFITYGSDNTYDIGASGANRPRNVYVAGTVTSSNVSFGGVTLGSSGNTAVFTNNGNSQTLTIGIATNTMMFGGITSSFPALKRSSTTLQVRLANDSDFAPVQGKLTTETAYTAGAPTATGYIVLYDSTGTAYRVPAVLN